MKKIVIHKAGSYDKLKLEEHDDLLLENENEVIIEVKYFGLNFADVCVRLGVYESAKEYIGWPITPGFEVSGIVKKIGKQVEKYKVGDEVIAFTLFNAYATEVKVDESQILTLPKSFEMKEGAGFPAVFFTAYHALYQHIVLHPKSNVLIHSAAGGVGTALVQLCNLAGAYTVGVIGSSHKQQYLEGFNPDVIIDKSKDDLWQKAKEVCPDGYHAVFDANGATTMKDSYDHLAPTGKLLVYGSHDLFSKDSKSGRINYLKAFLSLMSLPKFKPLEMITNNKGVIGFNISFLFKEKGLIEQMIIELGKLIEEDKIKPIPVTVFKMDDVEGAHRLIESGKSTGKIVISTEGF